MGRDIVYISPGSRISVQLDMLPSEEFYSDSVDGGTPIFLMAKKKGVKYSIYAFVEEGEMEELDGLLERMKNLLKNALLKGD